MRGSAALAAALLAAGCLASYGGEGVGSGIHGVATLAPACHAEEPDHPSCAPRPYEGKLAVTSATGGVGGQFSTRADGAFNVSLPPGEYTLGAGGEGTRLRCEPPAPIVVAAGAWTRVAVRCTEEFP